MNHYCPLDQCECKGCNCKFWCELVPKYIEMEDNHIDVVKLFNL